MAMKCCTKLETAKERCPIVFQGHPSNFKVTWDKTSPILTQIGHFRTIGRSQLSNPSDLPCYIWVRSRNCGCLVIWFCYQLIAKPGNKTATVLWPDPYIYIYLFIGFMHFAKHFNKFKWKQWRRLAGTHHFLSSRLSKLSTEPHQTMHHGHSSWKHCTLPKVFWSLTRPWISKLG